MEEHLKNKKHAKIIWTGGDILQNENILSTKIKKEFDKTHFWKNLNGDNKCIIKKLLNICYDNLR